MIFPPVSAASKLEPYKRRLFIGAYGFEQRSLGWTAYQRGKASILNGAIVFQYKHPKGKNRTVELRKNLSALGVSAPKHIPYDTRQPHHIEDIIEKRFATLALGADEVVIDISAMTKLLILLCLDKLSNFAGTLRLEYSEGVDYAPTRKKYEKCKKNIDTIAFLPSRGFESIVRTKSLSSIRMQGQPVTMAAFTSFNEQLVRHMLGTINPHRLLFINGRPPRKDYAWRERATQEIHSKLIDEYSTDNPTDDKGLLTRVASTLDYRETISRIEEIYGQFGSHERIICAATSSKMQTVGLFFCKKRHPDIHIEYPTPDSYFVTGMSKGVSKVNEIVIPQFSEFVKTMRIKDDVPSEEGYQKISSVFEPNITAQ